ncbi:MAG: hypothetical protein V4671_18185, partial [Armatimonadota bacterium]
SAQVLAFGRQREQGWVIVLDRTSGQYLEPITNPQDYLRRAGTGVLKIDAAYRDLISQWVTRH